jgi:hypothetical protein
MWEIIFWILAAWAVDPVVADTEPARANAAVVAAYAALAPELPEPEPEPEPEPDEGCCGECNGTGKIKMPDGHLVPCPCPADCDCKQSKEATCTDGKCQVRRR